MKKRLKSSWILFLTFGFASNVLGQWDQMAQPLRRYAHLPPAGGVEAFAGNDTTLFASGNTGVFRSTDDGVHWDSAGLSNLEVVNVFKDGENLFAGCIGGSTSSPDFFRSTDEGKSWTSIDSGFIVRIGAITKFNTILLAGCEIEDSNTYFDVIIRSTDGGITWTQTKGATNLLGVGSFSFLGTTIYASSKTYLTGVYSNVIFQSTDYGNNWTLKDFGLGPSFYELKIYGTTIFATTDSLILRSTNSGNSWDSVYRIPNGSRTGISDILANGTDFFAITYNDGVLRSLDNGLTWEQSNSGLTDKYMSRLFLNSKYLFAGTSYGEIWRRSLSDISSVTKNLPQSNLNISLSPNPTTGIITVHNAPANMVHVTITNVLGETVREVTNSGATDFTIDLSKLSQGTYFARFSSEGSIITRKIIKE